MTRTSTTLRFALLLTAANAFLDAHTYIARGGVFANVQTGNVIFFAMNASQGHLVTALRRRGIAHRDRKPGVGFGPSLRCRL